jgi:hypothetical protein
MGGVKHAFIWTYQAWLSSFWNAKLGLALMLED